MTERQRLANRRASTSFEFEVAGLRYSATVSHFVDGRIGELFLSNHKSNSAADTNEALKAAGATVFCSDIADRGCPLDAIIDFTNGAKPELAFAGIASNPPLGVQGRLTERFIEAGLHHIGGGGFLALLLSADFYSGKRRLRFFRDCPLFAAKIVLTRRIVWFSNPDPDKERPKENHAWFIWQNPPPGSAPLILYASRSSSSTSETATAGRPSSTPVTSSPEKELPMTNPTLRDVNADSNAEPEVTSIKKPEDKPSLDKFKSKKEPAAKVATLPTELPILKIADAKDYVRIHPDEEYTSPELCFVNVPIAGQKKDQLHLIDEDLALKYIPPGRILRSRLALATKPYDVLFLCQIPSRNLENDWNKAALKGIEQAKTLWTTVTSRKEEGVETYKVTWSEDPDAFPEPTWPIGEQTLEDMILTRFSGFCIDKADHPGLLRLRGKKQANS
jgi:hypothetical protein